MDSSIVFDLKQVNTRNKLQISQAYVQYHIFLYDQPNSRSKVSVHDFNQQQKYSQA